MEHDDITVEARTLYFADVRHVTQCPNCETYAFVAGAKAGGIVGTLRISNGDLRELVKVEEEVCPACLRK